MIRIQFIITGLSCGGAENMLFSLLKGLDQKKFSPHVISLTGLGEIGSRMSAEGIPVKALGFGRGIPGPIRFLQLVRRLRQTKPDVVQTWLYHSDLLGGLAARLAGIPYVIWGVRSADFFAGRYKLID